MTNRELEILEVIRKNPMISQNELADKFGITRSSAAVHITNLVKKGYILGKGYVVRSGEYVCIIGGTNMDIQGFPSGKLVLRDSNPGEVKMSPGGVGRNIGENLVRLGVETRLVTILGDDLYGSKLLEEARLIGLHIEDSLILKGQPTSTYMSILDESGDMALAISSMSIYDSMTVSFIKKKKHLIENARVCVVDTNMPGEVIEYLVTNFRETTFFLDTVSTAKAVKVKDFIGYFHTIKPNKLEAEMLSGIKITDEASLALASEHFLSKGVKRVFISLGEDGVYYNNGKKSGHLRSPKINVVNATGAGDAFLAGLVYCSMEDMSIDDSAKFAMTASILALSHENTINPAISIELINKKMEELGL
jgi:pseudouridine kinase